MEFILQICSKQNVFQYDTGGQNYLRKQQHRTLGEYGYLDVALDALFARTYPGYGYQFDYGATTLWEQWYEYGDMSSHNHAMFAGSCTFIIENLMGIKDCGVGFDKIFVKPDMTERVSKMRAKLDTVRGEYLFEYQKTDGKLTYTISIPFGSEAKIVLPDGAEYLLGSGYHVLTSSLTCS